jgi:hypothetical protein
MLFTTATLHDNLCFYTDATVAGDKRDELVRLRLSAEDLERVSAIQGHLKSIGSVNSLGKAVSNAIAHYYEALVAEGSVPPNL